MMKMATIPVSILFMLVFMAIPSESFASERRDGNRRGLYFGLQAGVFLIGDFESTRTNHGIPTNCDQWLPEETLDDGTTVPLPLSQCSPRVLPGSTNVFDLGNGFLSGIQAGYALKTFRIEVEYFRRGQGGALLPLIVPGDEKQAEFVERSEKITDFRADNIFANLYYDLSGMRSSGISPYLGAGVGLARQQMFYSAASYTDERPGQDAPTWTQQPCGRPGITRRRYALGQDVRLPVSGRYRIRDG